MNSNTYQIPVSKCKVDIGSIRGWNCFWPCLWSWVSQLCLAKWTGCIKGQRGAGCRVLLKGKGGGNKSRDSLPASFFLSFLFFLCAVEGQWHVPTMYGSAGYRVAVVKSKQFLLMERVGRMYMEGMVTDMRVLVRWRVKVFHSPLLCYNWIEFASFSSNGLRISEMQHGP